MLQLVESSIEAHGGLDRWRQIRHISTSLAAGGIGFRQRGQEAFTQAPMRVTIDTREQKTVFDPFLAPGQRAVYVPNRTTVEAADGALLEELNHPRDSFKNMAPGTPWKATQLAYFVGYAMWMYLTVPFSLLNDGVACKEAEPWDEDGETWRTLSVNFPNSYVTHSSEQTLYFDTKGMIRRQDYAPDISGGVQVAHYLHGHQAFDGIVFPTRRRVYLRGADRRPQKEPTVISADLSDFKLSRAVP
jgi:hypothetical protein